MAFLATLVLAGSVGIRDLVARPVVPLVPQEIQAILAILVPVDLVVILDILVQAFRDILALTVIDIKQLAARQMILALVQKFSLYQLV